MARRDPGPTAAAPPRSIRPLLGFRGRLGQHAVGTLVHALDDDEAFRGRVLAEATEAGVGRAGWVFLERADGWSDELDGLVAAEEDRRSRAAVAEQEHATQQRCRQLERTVDDLRARLAEVTAELQHAGADLEAGREQRRSAEEAARGARRSLAQVSEERDRAVSDLADARRDAAERLVRVRELEAVVAELREQRRSWSAPASEAVEQARAALDGLSQALEQAAAHLRTPSTAPPPGDTSGPEDRGGVGGRSRRGRPRRVPLRLARGALDDTVEATDQLLRAPSVVVLVDGYNVTMQAWKPLDAGIQRDRLVTLLGAATAGTGAEVHVVFDGDDDGRRPAVTSPLSVRVHFSEAGVEADDVLIGMAADVPTERPVVVVSSDGRVRDGVAAVGANLVHSAALLAWARR